ncbi:tyrosine-protein phosphatase non-receptor type substrate 1-like, partial [Pseudonaja textilis]|uniref:tyrosine-protein phosphatase non-receptor type substrate 1-like n=1 Tax=Pseudonaja textilis TaxID=8673 RepID=UPI000EA9358C
PPKLHLEINPPSPVQLNTSVTVTCNVESFYPEDVKVELFAKDAQARKGKVGMKTSNPDGTFSLKSNLEMLSTKDINFSTFLCLVQQDSQSPVYDTITLFITEQLQRSSSQRSLLLLCITLFLSKVVILSISSFLLIKRIRRNSQN